MLRTSALLVAFLIGAAAPAAAQAPRQVTCESVGDRYVECPIPENSTIKLVRTLSNSPCRPGRTYGGDRARIWVRSGCRGVFEVTPPSPSEPNPPEPVSRSYLVRCESSRNATSECPVDPSATVTLATQRSGTACTEGRTWGRFGGSIYVTRGCRAEFEVTPTARPGGFARPTNSTYWITCESRDERRFYCRVGTLDTARLSSQLSRSSCIEGRTWGIADGYLWVDDGCRAEFEVTRVR
jgi:Protein of unknown function (DUF3011)